MMAPETPSALPLKSAAVVVAFMVMVTACVSPKLMVSSASALLFNSRQQPPTPATSAATVPRPPTPQHPHQSVHRRRCMHEAKMSGHGTGHKPDRTKTREQVHRLKTHTQSTRAQATRKSSGCAHTTDVPDELCRRLHTLYPNAILRHVQLSHRAYLHDTVGDTQSA